MRRRSLHHGGPCRHRRNLPRAQQLFRHRPDPRPGHGRSSSWTADAQVRAILLASEGKNFCAGADFSTPASEVVGNRSSGHLYQYAVRLFRCETPIVAAVPGGGGRRRPGPVAGCRFPGRLAGISRFTAQFQPAGLPPRLRPERNVALGWSASKRRRCCSIPGAGSVATRPMPWAWSMCWPPRRSCARRHWDWQRRSPNPPRSPSPPPGAPCAAAWPTRSPPSPIMSCRNRKQHFKTADFKEGTKAMAERRLPVFQRQ